MRPQATFALQQAHPVPTVPNLAEPALRPWRSTACTAGPCLSGPLTHTTMVEDLRGFCQREGGLFGGSGAIDGRGEGAGCADISNRPTLMDKSVG